MPIGRRAVYQGARIAIGRRAVYQGARIAIGRQAVYQGPRIAIGRRAVYQGARIAIGRQAVYQGARIAIGRRAVYQGARIAIGRQAVYQGPRIAIGRQAVYQGAKTKEPPARYLRRGVLGRSGRIDPPLYSARLIDGVNYLAAQRARLKPPLGSGQPVGKKFTPSINHATGNSVPVQAPPPAPVHAQSEGPHRDRARLSTRRGIRPHDRKHHSH